jgi:uncharacterized protein (DUF58 family)
MFGLIIILAVVFAIVEISDSRGVDQAAFAVGLAAFIAYVWSRLSVRKLTLLREPLVDTVAVGDRFEEQLTLVNGSIVPKPWLEVFDESSLPGHGAGQVVRTRSKGSVRWRAHSTCLYRGEWELGPIRVRSGDPFGLFTRTVIAPETIKVVVWPWSASMPEFEEPGGVFSGGPRNGWSPYVSPSIAGIREYVAGDPFNRIAWSATARTNALMVKELEQDPISDIWLLLDLNGEVECAADYARQSLVAEGIERRLGSTIEYAVAVTASLARTYLERGRSVGLILSGFQHVVLNPDRGDAHFARVMDYLAVARADGATSIETIVAAHQSRFNRQSSVLVISSDSSDTWAAGLTSLAGLGVPVHALVVQAESFGSSTSSLPIIGALIAGNVPVTTIAYGDRIAALSSANAVTGDAHATRR